MDMFNAARITALLGAAALVSACTSTPPDDASLVPPPSMRTAAFEGTIPDYCPKVSLREGTAILRKGGEGAALQYVASITSTTRDCRILNGQMHIKVGVTGRVVPGPAAKPSEIGLPIRVVVTRGTEVLYSEIGSRALTLQPGGAEQFAYVDQSVVIPEPTAKDIVVYAGFDEGPQS